MRVSEQALNRLKVLKAICREGPVARTQLPELTGLSGGLITQLTSDLVERGLIVERREPARRPGRPRINLEIDAGGAIVIGTTIDSGDGSLTAAFVDLSGTLRFSYHTRLSPAATLAEMAHAIGVSLNEAIAASPYSRTEIRRVGIALAAIVDARSGVVRFVTTLPLGPEPFRETISATVGLPVTIENDITCMARAEHWFGRARRLDNFTLVNFGYALGSARYADGLPLTGTNGISPEIGHMKLATGPEAPLCYCGARGCAGMYASIYGLVQAAGLMEGFSFTQLNRLDAMFSQLLDRADAGDPVAHALFRHAGESLGLVVANYINASDPGDILIMLSHDRLLGRVSRHFDAALEANVLPGMLDGTRIAFAMADREWRWKGTAALALEQTFLSIDKATGA